MVEDKNPSQDTVQKGGHIVLQNVSYDKDVVEIKLADGIGSDNYGGNFVKDVCVDEGALLRRVTSEEKPLDRRSSPNLSCQVVGADSDIGYGKKDCSRVSVHGLKRLVVSPVGFAPHCNNEKQHSSGKECDLEDRIYAGSVAAGDPSEKKISLQELLVLESAEEESGRSGSGKCGCPLHEDAAGQTCKDGDPDVLQAVLADTSEYVSSGISGKENGSGCRATVPGTDRALDVREPRRIDRYNPFVDHRSLEDASVPECCVPGTTDSIRSVHSVTGGLDAAGTSEPGADTLSTSSSDTQPSEKSDNHSESILSRAISGAVDEITAATSSTRNSAEPRDPCGKKNGEKHADSRVTDQAGEEHSVGTDDADSCKSRTLAQAGPAGEQAMPDSSRSAARVGVELDTYDYEPNCFSGRSIMSGPVSMSGHLAYPGPGNASLRSESSTASTRSFAFPVLQGEWMGSPVRMAKAERRRRRAWRKGIICCKF